MSILKKAGAIGAAAALIASLTAALVAPAAFASTTVTPGGAVPNGGTATSPATFTLTENSATAFPNSPGTLTITLADAGSAATIHFAGTPTMIANGSLGAHLTVDPSTTFLTITTASSDPAYIEQIQITSLLSADAGAAAGAIKATLGGSLVSSITGGTETASGTIQTAVGPTTTSVTVTVTSSCGFAATGGSNTTANFSDISDPRSISTATVLTSGLQTLTIATGSFSHNAGATLTQTVADCHGTNLGSPGSVGAVATNHLVFTTQPGGGAPGVAWAAQPVVAVENTLNQIVTTDNTTVVTLSIGTNPAGGVLSCTSGLSRPVVNGSAAFFGCSISIGSGGFYTLVATSSPVWTPATSATFLVGGSGNHLAFINQPGGGPAGVAWLAQPSVAVENGLNQIITTDNTTLITLSIATNPTGGVVNCTSGLTRPVIAGIATFFGCSINLASASQYTLAAVSSPVNLPVQSTGFLITSPVGTTTLTDAIAPGVNHGTTGFGTASLVVPANSYITFLVTTAPNLAGDSIQIWTKTKTTDWKLVTSRVVAADGTMHYFARVNGWTAYQGRFAGDATHAPSNSHARIATNP